MKRKLGRQQNQRLVKAKKKRLRRQQNQMPNPHDNPRTSIWIHTSYILWVIMPTQSGSMERQIHTQHNLYMESQVFAKQIKNDWSILRVKHAIVTPMFLIHALAKMNSRSSLPRSKEGRQGSAISINQGSGRCPEMHWMVHCRALHSWRDRELSREYFPVSAKERQWPCHSGMLFMSIVAMSLL